MSALSHRQQAALKEMGIDVWVSRNGPQPAQEMASAAAPTAAAVAPESSVVSSWDSLNATIRACTRCDLHETRTQAVCGVGNTAAEWLVVGEAPGADEDRQGEPFVGRAGQLLNQMLQAAGRPREQVYIANVLKCRPPNNRDPQAAEVAACISYLQEQIALLQPKLILVI